MKHVVVDVVITRFIDDYQPGFVEFRLTDVHDREWVFEAKAPYVSSEDLWWESVYPQPGQLPCSLIEVLNDSAGVPFYRIESYLAGPVEDMNIFDVRHVKPFSS